MFRKAVAGLHRKDYAEIALDLSRIAALITMCAVGLFMSLATAVFVWSLDKADTPLVGATLDYWTAFVVFYDAMLLVAGFGPFALLCLPPNVHGGLDVYAMWNRGLVEACVFCWWSALLAFWGLL